jgi:hypothetical protein
VCACDENVSLVTWKKNDVICAHYVCSDKNWHSKDSGGYFCGFDIDAFDDCLKYWTIIKSVQEYIFYMLYGDKCRCGVQTKAILERVSCGDNPSYL